MPTGVVKAEFHNQGNVSQSRIRQVESLGPMEVIAHWTFLIKIILIYIIPRYSPHNYLLISSPYRHIFNFFYDIFL